MQMNIVTKIAYILLVVGGLNWGVIGFFNYNIIGEIFSDAVARIIYGAVGIAALHGIYVITSLKPSVPGREAPHDAKE